MWEATSTLWRSNWVSSGGGPHLVLPESLLPYWGGADDEAGSVIPPSMLGVSDYDRACSIRGYSGVLDVGPGTGLVLADEPNDTMWLRVIDDPGLYLVRWVMAESESQMIQVLHKLSQVDFGQIIHAFDVPAGELVLFDSAMPGNDLATGYESVVVEAGRYTVSHNYWRPTNATAAELFRLEKSSQQVS